MSTGSYPPMESGALVIQGDARHLPLPDASVDLVISSPPYHGLRSYRDGGEHYDAQIGSEATIEEFLKALWAVTEECMRVMKPTASMWINLGDRYAGSGGHNNSNIGADPERGPKRYGQVANLKAKSLVGLPWRYALGCIDRLGLILRAEVIWSKPNGLPESVTDRVRRSHEQWFHFVKQGRYFSAVDEVREAQQQFIESAPGPKRHKGVGSGQGFEGGGATMRDGGWNDFREKNGIAYNPLGKLPGSVWTIPSEPLIIPEAIQQHYDLPDHFAAFPQEWPRRIILGWSPSDGVVLDPFGGTGTVAMVARALGRFGVNGDLSRDYCRLAKWRIFRSGHAAKTEERTWRDAQGAMFG